MVDRFQIRITCEEERISSELVFYNIRSYDLVIDRLRLYSATKPKFKNGEYYVKDLITYNKLLIEIAAFLEQ